MTTRLHAVREVTRQDGRFQVSDDPEGVLSYLLGCFVDSPFAGEAAERFAPDGEGLALPDTLLAVRADSGDLAELPPELAPAEPDREWWLVSLERPHGRPAPAVVVISGDELRDLLRAAGLVAA
ncbi:MAG TPA: hypothetical protein VFT22_21750 [Kofleriaceae bacterium]|nr:hypothetical protein [Kofleriaceae bacterium]